MRMVHTIFFDGDQEKDFIRGLGVSYTVPFAEEVQNRHVRFASEDGGLWAEPIQPLIGRDGATRIVTSPNGSGDVYPTQLLGQRVPNLSEVNAQGQRILRALASWSDFKLTQLSPDGYTLVKRTNPQSTWLDSAAGKRAAGYAFVGDVSGGLGVSIKNFWQSYPAELEIRNATSPAAQFNAWLWSPDAVAMDMRHYDTRAHGLEESYEDVQAGLSTPYGVARTSELTLFVSDGVLTKAEAVKMAQAVHGSSAAGLHAPVLSRCGCVRRLERTGSFHAVQGRRRRPPRFRHQLLPHAARRTQLVWLLAFWQRHALV